jgi:hypothetical protein
MAQTLIQTITVGAGGASSLDFTGIPNSFTDLYISFSGRFGSPADPSSGDIKIRFNSATTGYSRRHLYGNGSSAGSSSASDSYTGRVVPYGATANTFSNVGIYIPNYAGSTNKSWSVDSVDETNATGAYQIILAGLWSNTAAITSISLSDYGGGGLLFAQGSTASLYGVTKAGGAYTAKATGGTIYSRGDGYVYHAFYASGTFTPTQSLTADVLVVAGGGAGGESYGAGGGGGGLTYLTGQSLTTTPITVTVGAGGVNNSTNGSNSSFGATTTIGGGLGGGTGHSNGNAGGSGGGGGFSYPSTVGAGGAGTAGQGYAGGNAAGPGYPNMGLGGGGGAGSAGSPGTAGGVGGAAGNGLLYFGTYYAGGGAGNGYSGPGSAGTQGGTAQNAAGLPNTGAGGGGDSGKNGGSGVVIVRYLA